MFTKSRLRLGFSFIVLLSLFFYACEQKESFEPEEQKVEESFFQKSIADYTQFIVAHDQGEGKYTATGAQGTIIEIDDALVNSAGERIRGEIKIELIEIYSVPDMILLQKQTMANIDGQLGILESGGELFIKVYQNDEEVFADGNGSMVVLLPTENTGGAKDNMELFYGEVIGDQVIWTPTGDEIRVVSDANRENVEYYQMIIQDVLGWVNVDVLGELQGEPVECVNITVDCDDICGDEPPVSMIANIYVNSLNSAFDIPASGSNSFSLCENFPLGGITVTFIVVVECPDGSMHVSIATTTVSPGAHNQVIKCDDLVPMNPGQFQDALSGLL